MYNDEIHSCATFVIHLPTKTVGLIPYSRTTRFRYVEAGVYLATNFQGDSPKNKSTSKLKISKEIDLRRYFKGI